IYVSCHDNLNLWDKICQVMPLASTGQRLAAAKFAFSCLLSSQGIAFVQAGDEFARSKKGCANSYNNNSPDVNPINWRLKDENRDLFTFVANLIKIRRQHPAFRFCGPGPISTIIRRVETGDDKNVIAYTIDGTAVGDSWREIVVIHNAGAGHFVLPIAGTWKIAVADGKSSPSQPLSVAGDQIVAGPLSTVVAWR
ncbi:MAG: type I pullulanase, partial [Negativicutes bacterium]|nr:type I pullulanase [Negativicutes bacterium]